VSRGTADAFAAAAEPRPLAPVGLCASVTCLLSAAAECGLLPTLLPPPLLPGPRKLLSLLFGLLLPTLSSSCTGLMKK